MHRKILVILLLFSVSFSVNAINIDSLQLRLHLTNSTNEKIQILNLLSKSNLSSDISKAQNFANEALFLSESIEDRSGKAEALYYLARCSNSANNHIESMNYLLQSREIFEKINIEPWIAESSYRIGLIYQDWLKYDKALMEFYKAMNIYEELKLEADLAKIFNAIGGIYYDRANYKKAFDYFFNSKNIYEKLQDRYGLAMTFNNIGEIYRLQGNSIQALNFFYQAIEINKGMDNLRFYAVNYDNLGNTYLQLQQLDSAGYYLLKSLEVCKTLNTNNFISMVNISLGNYYIAINDLNKAMKYFNDAYKLAKADNNVSHIRNAAKGISDIFATNKQFQKAYNYFLEYQKINDSINKTNISQEVTQLEMQLIFEGEQNLKKVKRQKNKIIYFLIAICLASLIVIIILLYGRQKIRIKYSKTEAENLELEKVHLEEDIAYKNKELATNVMYLLKKNELINDINEELVKIKLGFKKINQPIISDIIFQLQSGVDTNTWNLFDKWFGEVHKEFYQKLKKLFPKLTTNDKRLCALLRLNMTTKEIAAITNQNPNSVEVARTRLRKKLDISNKEISLVSFITSL